MVQLAVAEKLGAVKVALYKPFPCSTAAPNVPPLFDAKLIVAPVTGLPLAVTLAIIVDVYPLLRVFGFAVNVICIGA